MNFTKHPTNNVLLTAPPGMGNCDDLPATRTFVGDLSVLISFWTPTPEELERIKAGKPVMLSVWGSQHPPVSLGVDE